jgi:tetratricopeptide (TPR) repeat protein
VLYLLRVRDSHTPPGLREAAIAGVLCGAAVLSKESGAMMPILALLCVWGWPAGRVAQAPAPVAWRLWAPVLAAFAVAAVVVAVLRGVVLGGPVTGESIAVPGIDGIPASQRILAMLSLTPKIIGLLLWTPELNPAYGPSEFAQARGWVAMSVLLVLLALFFVAIRFARRGDRRPVVSLLWVFIAFLPASNLLVATGQILAERTLYIPSIGVAMCLALALQWAERVGTSAPRSRWVMTATRAVAAALILAGALRTVRWTEVWRSHESVHAQIIAADSTNYRGFWYTAVYLGNNGRMDAAFPLVERAFGMYSADEGLRLDYADALLRRGDARLAATTVRPLLESGDYSSHDRAVGVYLDALGRIHGPDSVISTARRLMIDAPSRTAALFLGTAYELRSDSAQALDAYRAGLRLVPADSLLRSRIARLESGR